MHSNPMSCIHSIISLISWTALRIYMSLLSIYLLGVFQILIMRIWLICAVCAACVLLLLLLLLLLLYICLFKLGRFLGAGQTSGNTTPTEFFALNQGLVLK